MGLGDFISGLFLKEEQKILRNQDKLEERASKTEKNTLSTSDIYSLTYFPYDFSKEFAPPLSPKQKAYIYQEIRKWFKLYYEVMSAALSRIISHSIKNEELEKYHQLRPEEFELMLANILEKNIDDIIDKILGSYSDDILINWKPVLKNKCFHPDDMEYNVFLEELKEAVREEIYDVVQEQKEDMKELVEIQSSFDSYEQKIKRLNFLIKLYLTFYKDDIIEQAFDRLIIEYYDYHNYVNSKAKYFNNDLFMEFHDTFKCSNFIELFSSVKEHLDNYFKTKSKEDLKKWVIANRQELFDFILDYYKNISEEELDHLTYRELSKYAFSMDCFTILLFKINLDGITA